MLNKYSFIVQKFHHINNYCEKVAYCYSIHLRGDDKWSTYLLHTRYSSTT